MAIETPHGPVVEMLLERGFAVFAINPKQIDRFRDRFTIAGAKDDSRDARVLGNWCAPTSGFAACPPTTGGHRVARMVAHARRPPEERNRWSTACATSCGATTRRC